MALVADDDPIVRGVLRSILTNADYTVVCAASGREAVAYGQTLDASVAILDLAMPDGDGVEACTELRKLPRWQHVPVLILTTYHTDKALSAARRAGATAFICKPFVPSQLLRRLAALTGQEAAPQATTPMVWGRDPPDRDDRDRGDAPPASARAVLPAPPADRFEQQRDLLQLYRRAEPAPPEAKPPGSADETAPRRRVLIADEEAATREMLSQMLSQAGYLTHCVANGQEALAAAVANEIDLILLSVRLPVVNGTLATHLIRSLPGRKSRAPIIALTTTDYEAFTRELIAAGMNASLTKPIGSDALLACVRQHLPSPDPSASPRLLELDRLKDHTRALTPGSVSRLVDNLSDHINDVLPSVQGWVAIDPAELRLRLGRLAEVARSLGCAALAASAKAIEAAPSSPDAARQEFVETVRATLAALQPYRL